MRDLQASLVVAAVVALSAGRVHAQPSDTQPVDAGGAAPIDAPSTEAPPGPSADTESAAEPAPPPAATTASPEQPVIVGRTIEIHGFVSEGAFVSTSNDYIGASSRGSVKLFEAGINFSTEVA